MSDRKKLVFPHDEVGKQIVALLQQTLGIPGNPKSFEVRFEVGQPITFTGLFYAQEPEGDLDEPADDEPAPRVGASLDDRG